MSFKWENSLEIALALIERHPKQEPVFLDFTALQAWVLALEQFDDIPQKCNGKILEAIQLCWIEER